MKKILVAITSIGIIMTAIGSPLLAYSPAELFTGNVYLAGSNPPELIFTHENWYEKNGNTEILTHIYRTPDGKVATVEKVTETGRKVDLYEVEFMNSECGCRLDRNGENMTFSFTRGNTDKKGVKPYESSLVTGPRLNTLAVENWDTLVSGKKYIFTSRLCLCNRL